MDDVVEVTGRESTAPNLALAHTIVSIVAGVSRDLDTTDIGIVSTSNARNLREAVCLQAVWLDDHPDALSAMNVTGVSQDGVSAQHASVYAAYLAPLAELCVKRLSWKRAPIRVRRAARGGYPDVGNRDSAVRDDQFVWTPMGDSGALGGGYR
jgi:hypothetical protein